MSRAGHISDDPASRIPPQMRPRIDNPSVPVDVHCHLFNLEAVPDKFLGIRIPMTRRFLGLLEDLLHRAMWWTDADRLSSIAYFINMARHSSMDGIAERLFGYHPDPGPIFCPLMIEMKPGIGGDRRMGYREQIEKMKELRDRYPDRLLPFIGLDPRKSDMEDTFLEAFSPDLNFFGVKLYPTLGFLPSDPRLEGIFNLCEAKNIPVTAHCGGASLRASACVVEDIRGVRQDRDGRWVEARPRKRFWTRGGYARFFNHPRNWEPVLKNFPRLKLNLAHFGSPEEWIGLCDGKNNSWVSRIMDIMSRYERVYADFANNIYCHRIFGELRRKIEGSSLIAGRTLYGSDYYMVVMQGHFRSIRVDFLTAMGDEIMDMIAVRNPRRFLLD